MLYVTTRNNDAYTAHRALVNDRGIDGDAFVPFHVPQYTAEQLLVLKEHTFNQTVAEILNTFFTLRLSGWDLDLTVGRNLLRIVPMNHRIAVAELWHNPGGNYAYIEKLIYQSIEQKLSVQPSLEWPRIAVKIAVLFGIYGQMLRDGVLEIDMRFDISVRDDDFITPAAAMYCRMMGMPIDTIICACSKDHRLWDFVHRGIVSNSGLDQYDRDGAERLLHSTMGYKEAARFYQACAKMQGYEIGESLSVVNKGWFCSVIGDERAQAVINSVYRTNGYFVDVDSALCYGSLRDYRAKSGESQLTLILAERNPLSCTGAIAAATGLDAEQLAQKINQA